MDIQWVTCPLCGDDVRAPGGAAEQATWLRERAAAMVAAAAEIEAGNREPFGKYDSALD